MGTTPCMNRSLWHDRSEPSRYTDLDAAEGAFDDVVVGAGLTGLTTGLLLARAGRRVLVLEARGRGAATTGHTTAKVSLLQGTKLSRMRRHHSEQLVSAYVDANREGQAWVLRFAEDHGVAVERRPAATYAATGAELKAALAEHEAATAAGLAVRWHERLDLPFPHAGATVLEDQVAVHPMQLVDALADDLRAHGGLLHEGSRVTDVSWDGRRVTMDDGRQLSTSNVILATGTPILDRGLVFSKVEAHRSYVLVMSGAVPPREMLLSAGSPGVSLRGVVQGGEDLLMIGGLGHVVGRDESERARVGELRSWAREIYPEALVTHSWSAQDYSTPDGVPYVGLLPRGRGRIYAATGFDKWGMTNGVAASLAISAEILGDGPPAWQQALRHRLAGPRQMVGLAQLNAGVGVAVCKNLGGLGRRPLCSHLGGVLRFNDSEGTWDCPLHGSRFAADGSVIEGPATRAIGRRPDATEY